MPDVVVTAPNGVRLRARIQKLEQRAQIIQTQGYDERGNPTIVQSYGPKIDTWPDQQIISFASDTKTFVVDEGSRVIIEADR